jgi:fatty-acyl-CoA synthase
LLRLLREWGSTFAAGISISAIRYPDHPAVIDERGVLSFEQLDERSNALGRALSEAGVARGDRVALLCRNHRGFIEAMSAAAKLGVDALYLNTDLAAPVLVDVLRRERLAGLAPAALIYDEEFAHIAADVEGPSRRFVAWSATDASHGHPTLDDAIAAADRAPLPPPRRSARMVILTSGTTGTPKFAMRKPPASAREAWEPTASFLSRVPLKARQATVIAVPLHHFWGLGQFMLTLPLSSTCVLRRHFDPEETLRAVADSRASVLDLVPVMLQRMLELPAATRDRYDVSCLRVIALSGSALRSELALQAMDTFGDIVYNIYGSTEVSAATIATPAELRAAPGTSGRAPLGTIVRLLDDGGGEVRRGERGRIFVGNGFLFQGYEDGDDRELVDGLMSTGDVGHVDDKGRLFVEGREDDMIISGGESVYPREVEDLLVGHDRIREAAVVGVPDERFGERLRAFVVANEGEQLSQADVQNIVRANLARYKVPRDVVFLAELPRNAAGKVLKGELVGPE